MAEEIKIVVGADTSKLQAALAKAESDLKSFQSQLNSTGDSKKLDELNKKIAETQTIISSLKTQIAPVKVTGDNTDLINKIAQAEKELEILKTYQSQIKLSADSQQLDSALLQAENELKAINSQISIIQIKGDSTQIDATIGKVESELLTLKAAIVPITADPSQIDTTIANVEGELTGLGSVSVPISADTAPLTAEVIQAENSLPPAEVIVEANLGSITDIKKFVETNLRDVQQLQANININANTEVFVKELKRAEDELKNIQSELSKVSGTAEFNKLSQNAKVLQGNIANLKTQITATSGAISKMPQQLNSASYSVTNLSRIVSDSAYGFIGIANNIGPFVDSLAAAKKEAQATGTSVLKNLVSSLKGPAGLSLAFAAVTTAITFAQIGFSAWTRSAQKTKEVIDDIKKSQQEFAKSLESAKASALSSGLALQGYVDVAKNSTLPIEQRNEALKKANEILGEHGKKLTLANIATKEITDQTNLYTQALIAQAVATKYTDELATKIVEQQKLQNQLKQAQKDSALATTELSNVNDKYNKKLKDGIIITNETNGIIAADIKLKGQKADADNKTLEIQKQLKAVTNEIARLQSNANDATLQATQAFGELGTKTKDTKKEIETLPQALAKFEKELINIQNIGLSLGTPQFEINQDKIKEFEAILKKIVEKFNVKTDNKVYIDILARLNELQLDNMVEMGIMRMKTKLENAKKEVKLPFNYKVEIPTIPIPNIAKSIKPLVIPVKVNLDLEALKGSIIPPEFQQNLRKDLAGSLAESKKAWEDYSKNINDAATTFLVGAATNIAVAFGQALGAALTGGNFGDVFAGVFELLAGGVEALGQKLIEIGFLAVIAQQSLKTILSNPYAAIAVGIALTALGAALKNLTSKNKFAVGTRYAPGGMALVGERGPELVSLPRGSQVIPTAQTAQMLGGIGGQIEVFGMLRGQDIYFSNKKYGRTYGRTT